MTLRTVPVSVMSKVEAALTRAAQARPIPDYYSFQSFMSERIERERTKGKGQVHAISVPTATAAAALLTRYHVRAEAGEMSPMDFRRYKLLRSFFADGGRGEGFAQALMSGEVPQGSSFDDEVRPADLRMRLMAAISSSNFEDASFLLGRLDEKDHDPGERAFFHAFSACAAGNWDKVIAHVARVPRDAIDRPRAVWLAAKAFAVRGDLPGLIAVIDEIGAGLSACAWVHLVELLGAAGVRSGMEPLYSRFPSPLALSQADPVWAEWATLHVRLLGQFLAREREIAAAGDAMANPISDQEWTRDAGDRPGAVAFMVEAQLGGDINLRSIVSRLHPLIAKRDMRAFRTAIELLFECGDHQGVVELARQFRSGVDLPWQRDLDVIGLIYASAILVGDRLEKRIRRFLIPERLESSANAARRLATAKHLTAMGRLSYLAAAAECDRVAAAGDQWRDCGLIALGLFRAVEIELNARLARPLARRLDFTALIAALPQGPQPLRELLQKLRSSRTGNGLVLGELRKLIVALQPNTKNAVGTATVRASLIEAFASMLSRPSDCSAALEDFRQMIDSAAVNRFRNSPAHGEFVRLPDAVAALHHTERALPLIIRHLPRAE